MQHWCKLGALIGHPCKNEAYTPDVHINFMNHMNEWGLSYGTQEEYDFRLSLFQQKDQEIREINADPENTFTVAHNMFSTMTKEEASKRLGYAGYDLQRAERFVEELDTENLETSVDWRTKGAVNAVKDQGQCGSCWTFSAVCAMEGAHQIKTGKLLSLAEQQFVDCDKTSYGCRGGWQAHAFKHAEAHAEELESAYRYTARDGSCKEKSSLGKVKVTGYKNVPSNSVAQLKAAINKQPVSVTIEADKTCFQNYHSGIMNSQQCGTNLDHAVAAVGYGDGYYIVRNSWGSRWGDNGYIKIATVEGKGICGIQMDSLYPSTD